MYPSKSDGMFVRESLIFRSDSNGEDLEGYAGAGLYDSITMDPTELRKVDYASDRRARWRGPCLTPLFFFLPRLGCGTASSCGSRRTCLAQLSAASIYACMQPHVGLLMSHVLIFLNTALHWA